MYTQLQTFKYQELIEEITACSQIEYSGKLEIKSDIGHQWSLHYRFGRIIWATGRTHTVRRFHRRFCQHLTQININEIDLKSVNLEEEDWDHQLLTKLYIEKKLDRNQLEAFVKDAIVEVLFDIVQQANLDFISYQRNPKVILGMSLSFISTDIFLKRLEVEMRKWSSAQLANFSANSAP
ncbi:MAG: response regulator, partial [Cyanobacteria bacterium P01_A01_bin.68]